MTGRQQGTTEHTPGPWSFETVDTSCGICHKIGPFPYARDHKGHACIYVDHNGWEHKDELEANAHLIAASPDLLEALVHAVNIIREHVPKDALGSDMSGDLSEPHLTYSWQILDEHLHYMDAAINKAKGVIK